MTFLSLTSSSTIKSKTVNFLAFFYSTHNQTKWNVEIQLKIFLGMWTRFSIKLHVKTAENWKEILNIFFQLSWDISTKSINAPMHVHDVTYDVTDCNCLIGQYQNEAKWHHHHWPIDDRLTYTYTTNISTKCKTPEINSKTWVKMQEI